MKAEGLPVLPLNTTSLVESLGALTLMPGRLYMVTILERDGNQALVSLGGKRFYANLQGPMPDSGRVAVTVREATADLVVLERASRQLPPLSELGIQRASTAEILQRIGLPPELKYLTCLPHLMEAGQAITPEIVRELADAWVTLANSNIEALPVLARLQAEGLPLTTETLKAAASWNGRPLLVAKSIQDLAQSLGALAKQLEGEPSFKQLQPLPDFLRVLARTLWSVPLAKAGDPTTQGHLSQFMQTFATPLEAQVAKLLGIALKAPEQPWPPSQASGRSENGQVQQPTQAVETIPYDAGREQPTIKTAVRPGEFTQPAPNPDQSEEKGVLLRNPGSLPQSSLTIERNIQVQMRRLAVVLERLVEEPVTLSQESREALATAREHLGNVLSHVDAQNIANLRVPPDATIPHYYAFSLPVSWSGPADEAQLRIYYRPGGKAQVDPRNTHLSFRLFLEKLGKIDVDLHIFRNLASCDVSTDEPKTRDLALAETPRLREGLQRIGYQVQSISCAVKDHDKDTSTTSPSFSNLDLRLVDLTV